MLNCIIEGFVSFVIIFPLLNDQCVVLRKQAIFVDFSALLHWPALLEAPEHFGSGCAQSTARGGTALLRWRRAQGQWQPCFLLPQRRHLPPGGGGGEGGVGKDGGGREGCGGRGRALQGCRPAWWANPALWLRFLIWCIYVICMNIYIKYRYNFIILILDNFFKPHMA